MACDRNRSGGAVRSVRVWPGFGLLGPPAAPAHDPGGASARLFLLSFAMPIPAPPARPDADRVPDPAEAARLLHWRRTRRLTAALLAAWGAVGFGIPWFARDLEAPFFGWPFGFWVAAQGGVIVFVALIAAYAWRMRRIDRALDAPES